MTLLGYDRFSSEIVGPLIDLLLVVYKRRPAAGDGTEILGNVELLELWLERVSFG